MKKYILPLIFALISTTAFSQLNIEFLAKVTYPGKANDIWGYEAADGTEYAIVGLKEGISIVDLSIPTAPVEVANIPGETSVWRDIKTFGDYAYVTTDQNGTSEGLTVIDLSDLPNSADYMHWTPLIPGMDTLFQCHNLFIDESGYAYLTGCNVNSGGAVFVDVFSEPGNPKFVGLGQPTYSHDVYVKNNLLYTSEILEGRFGIYDISDKEEPILLATQITPFRFTHNAWLSDDENVLFTTDEKKNASTAAYDVSDLNDIKLLDEYRPLETIGNDVIPHNVHVLDNYLVISHYTDGVRVVDATRPENLIEVGNYDTWLGPHGGFNGAWGAYPYLNSGLILVSDINGGLFVLQPTYKKAAYLEGNVVDAETGDAIPNASIQIVSSQETMTTSDLFGNFKTGQVLEGTFEVQALALGYYDATVSVELVGGEITNVEIQMDALPRHSIEGIVYDRATQERLPNASILIENDIISYTTTSDMEGLFSIPVIEGNYTMYAGKWGYRNYGVADNHFDGEQMIIIELDFGYQDNFNQDFEWEITGDATSGVFERGVPRQTTSGNKIINPGQDAAVDFGEKCYVTGIHGEFSNDADVDGGSTILTSPLMDLESNYNRPMLSYYYWFVDAGGNVAPDDSLTVILSNGVEEIIIDVITESAEEWRHSGEIDLANFIDINTNMTIAFRTADPNETFHLLEVGIDNFEIKEGLADDLFSVDDEFLKMRAYPNPFETEIFIDYKIEKKSGDFKMLVLNVLGQEIESFDIHNSAGTVHLTPDLAQGTYFVVFRVNDEFSDALRVVKGL